MLWHQTMCLIMPSPWTRNCLLGIPNCMSRFCHTASLWKAITSLQPFMCHSTSSSCSVHGIWQQAAEVSHAPHSGFPEIHVAQPAILAIGIPYGDGSVTPMPLSSTWSPEAHRPFLTCCYWCGLSGSPALSSTTSPCLCTLLGELVYFSSLATASSSFKTMLELCSAIKP